MYEIESNILLPEEPEAIVVDEQSDEYGPTPEQKRMYLKQRQALPLSIKVKLTERRMGIAGLRVKEK